MTTSYQTFKFLALSALALPIGMEASIKMSSPAFAETVGQYIDDATITAKVKEAILANPSLKVLQMEVETIHGTVTLSGSVDTKFQEEEAIRVAKTVNGVARVTDNLSVKGMQAD